MRNLENVIKGMDFKYFAQGQHIMQPEAFLDLEDVVLLDVRAKVECETIGFNMLHHCKVLEIPVNEVPTRINEIPKDKLVGVFCSGAIRATIIFTYLIEMGYRDVKILAGGYNSLMEALLPGKIYKKLTK